MTRRNLQLLVVPGLLLAVVLGFSLVTDSLYRYQLGTLAGIYAVAAVGLGLLLGGSGQISLGHAGFVGAAAWAVGVFTREQGWPWLLAAAVGIIIATLVGVVLGYAALRLEGHYLALATLAFGLLFFEFMDTYLTAGIYGHRHLRIRIQISQSSLHCGVDNCHPLLHRVARHAHITIRPRLGRAAR